MWERYSESLEFGDLFSRRSPLLLATFKTSAAKGSKLGSFWLFGELINSHVEEPNVTRFGKMCLNACKKFTYRSSALPLTFIWHMIRRNTRSGFDDIVLLLRE